MTTFDEREQGFERKFAHDEELAFKTTARRNKLFGLWAAEKLGKTGAEAEAYAKEVVLADFEVEGDLDLVTKVVKDFEKAGIAIDGTAIEQELLRLKPIARQQITGSAD